MSTMRQYKDTGGGALWSFNYVRLSLILAYLMLMSTSNDNRVVGLHLTGTFTNKDFFRFLVKFGFQKADKNNRNSTTGYIYGNVKSTTGDSRTDRDMYLVVVDSHYVVEYYAHKDDTSPDRCTLMFVDIDAMGWDKYCSRNGKEDFLRRIPCPDGKVCTEELGNPSAVMKGQQFTYHIEDLNQPRYI